MNYLPEDKIKEILDQVVEQFLIPRFEEKDMNASGEWKANVSTEVRGDDGIIRGRKYTEQLVYGRRPGTFAPIEPLKQWAMIKLGLDERAATSMAFGISHKMKQEGSRYFRQGGTDLLEILHTREVLDFINTKTKNFLEVQLELELRREISRALKL